MPSRTICIDVDVTPWNRVAWSLARFFAVFNARGERDREARLLAVDREHAERAKLDVQVVTGSDGATRVVTRPLGRWHRA